MGVADANEPPGWLLRIAQGLAVVFLLCSMIRQYIASSGVKFLAKRIGIPVALLHVFDWLGSVTGYLDAISLSAGDINISLFALIRTLRFWSTIVLAGPTLEHDWQENYQKSSSTEYE